MMHLLKYGPGAMARQRPRAPLPAGAYAHPLPVNKEYHEMPKKSSRDALIS